MTLDLWGGSWVTGCPTLIIIDWVFGEDRSTIRVGYGLKNMTRIRRFAIGLIKSKATTGISKKMRQLNKNTRAVLDYFKITKNAKNPCIAWRVEGEPISPV